MVHDVIDNDGDPACVRLDEQRLKIRHRAIVALDSAVVLDRVTMIVVGALEHGHEPDAADTQALQVVEARDKTLQVSDTVAVRILVAAHVDFEEGRRGRPVGWQTGVRRRDGHGREVQRR